MAAIQRPNSRCTGQSLNVVANHFPLTIENKILYHYDVTIEVQAKENSTSKKKHKPMNRKINMKILDEARKHWGIFKDVLVAYDGEKNVYTSKPLNIRGRKIFDQKFTENGTSPKDYTVSIEPVTKEDGSCQVDLSSLQQYPKGPVSQEAMTALAIVLRHCPSLALVQVYQAFFNPQAGPLDVISDMELKTGFRISPQPGYDKLTLNLDLDMKLFYKNNASLPQNETELKRLKVYTSHLKERREYTIFSLAGTARKQTFQLENEPITVLKFFKDKYNIKLKYPDAPVLNVGNKQFPVYFPAEICSLVENQIYDKKLTHQIQTQFIRKTALKPQKKFEMIESMLKEYLEMSRLFLKHFGITIVNQPMVVPAVRIKAPNLKFSDGIEVVKDGSWNLSKKLYRPKELSNWMIISFMNRTQAEKYLEQFQKSLKVNGSQLGMKIMNAAKINYYPYNQNLDTTQFLINCFTSEVKLALIILSSDSDKCTIKSTGDNTLEVPTICIKDSNLKSKCQDSSFVKNILLKINAKLGGTNWTLDSNSKVQILKNRIILMGADVNHAAPFSNDSSIAAVVASVDGFFAKFEAETRTQPPRADGKTRTEIIVNLKKMALSLFKSFKTLNNKPPEALVFYRDGVGEGQEKSVKDEELKMLREAFVESFPDKEPKITFVLVLKRHRTRFMPHLAKSGNVPPGTVVEEGVTQRLNYELFICSQAGNQGTVVPTKYRVIHDDNKLSSEDFAYLNYQLCHLYPRCNKSIRLPVPVQHAHHWATKGKEYYLAADDDEDDSLGSQ